MWFSRSVVSDSLRPHGLQHARLCPSPTPGVCANSCPIKSVMPSNHLILCRPLLLLLIFPSIRVFSNESVLRMRWPKYWSFSFSISLSKEYSGQISLRIDWFDLLAVQGTLKSLLPHYNLKASVLQRSAFLPAVASIHDCFLFPQVVHEVHGNGLCPSREQSHFHCEPGPGAPGAVPPLHGAPAETAGPAHGPQERYRGVPGGERSQLRAESTGIQADSSPHPNPHLSSGEGYFYHPVFCCMKMGASVPALWSG